MQNPSPPQQGYGSSTGTPGGPMTPSGGGPNDKTSLGLEGKVAAAIGYVIGLLAIVMFFMEKENKFARFHAIQAVLYWVAVVVIFIALGILAAISSFISGYLAALFGLFYGLAGLAAFVGCLFMAWKAYQGERFVLPVVGNMAANMSNK
jgi:uncharacterized membrane protein